MSAIRKSLAGLAAALVLGLSPVNAPLFAQEGKAKPAAKAKAPQFSEKDWPSLVARKQEFLKKLDSLKDQFEAANKAQDDEARQKLARQFQTMQREFVEQVQPGLLSLAPAIYAKNPTDVDAAEIVITEDFQENRYRQVIEKVNKVFAAGKKSAPLLTFLGVSQFATHDFEGAKESLTEARDADLNVFPVIGGPFLEACTDYPAYWKEEQALRAKEKQANDLPQVQFKTTKGDIIIELFENEAPNTVANFISLVEKKKYDHTRFHRVIPNFMAQGGDPNTLDDDPQNDGQGGPGYSIACECYGKNARRHFQGTLSMAHAGKDTGGSQFFITHLPTPHLNPDPELQKGHTVFGRVVKGLDVALALRIGDEIESAKVLRKRDHEYKPKTQADPRASRKKAPVKSDDQ
jgi:cyclophilin family peptidyl-prolyl cis-trans isomerase